MVSPKAPPGHDRKERSQLHLNPRPDFERPNIFRRLNISRVQTRNVHCLYLAKAPFWWLACTSCGLKLSEVFVLLSSSLVLLALLALRGLSEPSGGAFLLAEVIPNPPFLLPIALLSLSNFRSAPSADCADSAEVG